MKRKVFFIGAGPGDKELITLKALNIIKKADIIIYAGSLVNKEILNFCENKDVKIYNSAKMTLEETHKIISDGYKQGMLIARIHTGDPSIYGAIFEQMILLEDEGIDYEIIPGVSSAFAAAAAVKCEYTLPEISQTVIFTRMEGKTPVPEREKLENIAKIGSTLIIFLSVGLIEKVKEELLKGGVYNKRTPVIIVKKASWEDEEIFYTNIEEMSDTVKKNNIRKTALILVGEVFNPIYRNFNNLIKSKLYDKSFETEYRKNNERF